MTTPSRDEGGVVLADDWTRSEDGRSNNSREFHETVVAVAMLIRDSSGTIFVGNWPMSIARLIVAQLAHEHGFRPKDPDV